MEKIEQQYVNWLAEISIGGLLLKYFTMTGLVDLLHNLITLFTVLVLG